MRKIVNPCICDAFSGRARAFAKIEYNGRRLTITGVVGPMKNGNSRGSAGQCVDTIRNGTPVKGWTSDMLEQFCDTWERWHLNDLRPECEHQRELGWPDMAKERITLSHYRLTSEASKAKREVEEAARNALRKGAAFIPTAEQMVFAILPHFLDTYELIDGKENAQYYEPMTRTAAGYGFGFTEQKCRAGVKEEESELGLLCKPCPVCGYQYGSAWKREEVPQDVLDWLFALPDAEKRPAWV